MGGLINQIAVPLINDNYENLSQNHFSYSILESDSTTTTSTYPEINSLNLKNLKKIKEMEGSTATTTTNQSSTNNDTTGCGSGGGESFLSSYTCPYPLCVTWWQTIDKRNRAVIGYSDGSICFVALTPNCPFIGNTSVENCSIQKLVICRDNNEENVTLLINTSTKEQWKLLLEQKSIKYLFPADLSPTTATPPNTFAMQTSSFHNDNNIRGNSEDDWTFVMQIQPSGVGCSVGGGGVGVEGGGGGGGSSAVSIPININNEKLLSNEQKSSDVIENFAAGSSHLQQQLEMANNENVNSSVGKGLLPAAKARLSLLKNLGTKKLNAIRLRLSDAKTKLDEYITEESLNSFAMVDSPTTIPEILTTPSGPYYCAQNLHNTLLLSALHSYSDILSIHRMDLKLIPLFHYKIPKNCQDIMISSNILYSIQLVNLKKNENENESENTKIEVKKNIQQDQQKLRKENDKIFTSQNSKEENHKLVNAVGVISSAMASIKNGDIAEFNEGSMLGLFPLPDEQIINIHKMATYESTLTNFSNNNVNNNNNDVINDLINDLNQLIDDVRKPSTSASASVVHQQQQIKSPSSYVRLYRNLRPNGYNYDDDDYTKHDIDVMKEEFPKVNYDPCIVVTNKNTYFIHLHNEPYKYFLNASLANRWDICEDFCTTFDLSYSQCIEFAGDTLLHKKKVTQALVIYNAARIPPVRTALKLAMYGENYALMHLCAMALKSLYILKSRFISHRLTKFLLNDYERRYCDINELSSILPKKPDPNEIVLEGKHCSDYFYGTNEQIGGNSGSVQMVTSSQFHLSNLLLITLTECAVKDKIYNIAVWNFIASNTKFHTNMTSIVLCQSGLYMAALLLAMIRGCCIDVFIGLISVSHQEFGWYSEINVLFYNLSELLFCECITYLRHVSADYFDVIQQKIKKLDETILKRLEKQLNPFSPIYRPIVSHRHLTASAVDQNDIELLEFNKLLIETYLTIIMQLDAIKSQPSNILNALNTHRINYEDNQFAIESSNFPPISAGCSHCACIIDGCAYFWGSCSIPLVYNVGKPIDPPEPPHAVKCLEILAQLNLEVHAVKCGRQHSLILTNNGLYAFGSNSLGQLGISRKMQMALQPMLVESLDSMDITILEAGQYHNAVVADGNLYTWGWGVYGQLGHGDVENVSEPKIVKFFKGKRILQVSLGHSHSLVLCTTINGKNELFVFGSNHFGQLGVEYGINATLATTPTTTNGIEENINNNDKLLTTIYPVKSLVPIKIVVSRSNIRLIHTKFFCNFAVNENNELFTWGTSPQALRLTNQIKRRANAKQKIGEHLKKEFNRRMGDVAAEVTPPVVPATSDDKNKINDITETPILIANSNNNTQVDLVPIKKSMSTDKLLLDNSVAMDCDGKILNKKNSINQRRLSDTSNNSSMNNSSLNSSNIIETHEHFEVNVKIIKNDNENEAIVNNNDDDAVVKDDNAKVEDSSETKSDIKIVITKSEDDDKKIEKEASNNNEDRPKLASTNKVNETDVKPVQITLENETYEHMTPQKVDTSEVSGQILQISSGLLHFALISSTSMLFTWGKNLEHQLGTEDKDRKSVNKPTPLESIEFPLHVECGTDFTIVLTRDFTVKAFGGNAHGQCGRYLAPSSDKTKSGKIFCLPTTKRLMRLESSCIESPIDVPLPRPRIRMDYDLIRYLKSIPKFHSSFIIKPNIKSFYGIDSSKSAPSDCGSSVENLSFLDEDSLCSNLTGLRNLSSNDISPADDDDGDNNDSCCCATNKSINNINNNNNLPSNHNNSLILNNISSDLNEFRNYIHYCLYIFHGLYDNEKILEYLNNNIDCNNEFRIRLLMLNYKYIDAFKFSLIECINAQQSIKIFEYFTKDPSIVPMRRKDLKYFIYYLFHHFIEKKFDMNECEKYFLCNLDYYLFDIAYILYFNNNNSEYEQKLKEKYKKFFINDEDLNEQIPSSFDYNQQQQQHDQQHQRNQQNQEQQQQQQEYQPNILEDSDLIFENITVKFKAIVCQKLLLAYTNN